MVSSSGYDHARIRPGTGNLVLPRNTPAASQAAEATPAQTSPPASGSTDGGATTPSAGGDRLQAQTRPAASFSSALQFVQPTPTAEPSPALRASKSRVAESVRQMLRTPANHQQVVSALQALRQITADPAQLSSMTPERLREAGGPALAWLANNIDPALTPAEMGAILTPLTNLLTPVADLIQQPTQNREQIMDCALAVRQDADPLGMWRALQQGGLLTPAMASELIGIERTIDESTGSGSFDNLMSLSFRSGGRINTGAMGQTLNPMDRARSRLLVASERNPQELSGQLSPLLERLQQNPRASLDPAETQLLERFGITASNGTLSVRKFDGEQDSTVLTTQDIGLLRRDIQMLANPATPTATRYVRALQTVARQTGEYQAAIAELERLGEQRQEIVTRRDERTEQGNQVEQALSRLDAGIVPQDEAFFKELDPSLSFTRGEGGQIRILRDGEEITPAQLRTELQQKREILDDQVAADNEQIAEKDLEIVAQRQEAAQKQAALEASIAEAEQAFQAMPPEEQAQYGDLHRNTLQQARQALAEGARILERLDALFAHIPGYAEARQAPSSRDDTRVAEAIASANALAAESVLAPAPQGASSAQQDEIARQERESLADARRELARSSDADTAFKQQTESQFLNRIFEMRRELAEHETERRSDHKEAIEREARRSGLHP
ncbi:MAG: hypothetical protein ACO1RX_14820 [Candidatus Sericytochromatia bacterium]